MGDFHTQPGIVEEAIKCLEEEGYLPQAAALKSRVEELTAEKLELANHIDGCVKVAADALKRVDREKEITRLATIETCARELETSYPDHAWLNAACAAIRGLSVSLERQQTHD